MSKWVSMHVNESVTQTQAVSQYMWMSDDEWIIVSIRVCQLVSERVNETVSGWVDEWLWEVYWSIYLSTLLTQSYLTISYNNVTKLQHGVQCYRKWHTIYIHCHKHDIIHVENFALEIISEFKIPVWCKINLPLDLPWRLCVYT